MIYLLSLVSRYFFKQPSHQNYDFSQLPDELLKIIFEDLNCNALKNLNQANQKLRKITNNCNEYVENKKIQILARQIVGGFEPKIMICPYHQGPNLKTSIDADTRANEQCSGLYTMHLGEKKSLIIKYQADLISIPIESHSIDNSNSLFSGYQCRFTEKAAIIVECDDNDLASSAKIAQNHINKLLEANSTNAKNLKITL
ncbi:MAG: hypothetical protein H0V82_01745 [Candidatus Protochlamydia sp.]|nr:hypothetical protein [Candidatus Protochlamydia sp.]